MGGASGKEKDDVDVSLMTCSLENGRTEKEKNDGRRERKIVEKISA